MVQTRITLDPKFADCSELSRYAEQVAHTIQGMIFPQNYRRNATLSLRVLLLEDRPKGKYTLHAHARAYQAYETEKRGTRSRLLSVQEMPGAVKKHLKDAEIIQDAVIHFFQSHKKREA